MPQSEQGPSSAPELGALATRVDELAREVGTLRAELAQLRGGTAAGTERVDPRATQSAAAVIAALRQPPRRPTAAALDGTSGAAEPGGGARRAAGGATTRGVTFGDRLSQGATLHGQELESFVGRYGTLLLAALVTLMALGALIKLAVERGLITPEVRIAFGLLAVVAMAAAGLHFRRRGDVRYGSVLLALSLAMLDLVAWGAGPRLHLVPTGVALIVVDIASIALVALALSDESEFLFLVAIGGALSAPFVTSSEPGSPLALLAYGAAVLTGAVRTARHPEWRRAFALIVAGALVYALAAAELPVSTAWYGAYLVALFGAVCAIVALTTGEEEWRGDLPRALLATAVIGVLSGWDQFGHRPLIVSTAVALGLAVVTYLALLVRTPTPRHWAVSAPTLPLLSLGIAMASTSTRAEAGTVLVVWTALAMMAWRLEGQREERERGGTHLLVGGVLGGLAIATWLWSTPLGLVAGLSGWATLLSWLTREEKTPLPFLGVAAALGAAGLSALDQLASRWPFSYTPLLTRSSASALVATLGVAAVGLVLATGGSEARRLAERGTRIGAVIGFAIVWGRMEVAHAFNRDLATFLLMSYYAACGVASILAGRTLGIGRLRAAGLALAIYAAVKAIAEATDIGGDMLRVGAYAAVGVFLLGAGYLYRERGEGAAPTPAAEVG